MRTLILALILAVPMAFTWGCSKEISRRETTTRDPYGNTTVREDRVVRDADGTIRTERTRATNP